MMFNATFNNISIMSWQSVLLVEDTEYRINLPTCRMSHNCVSSTPRLSEIQTHNGSGDRNWFHRYMLIQLSYDHDHDSPYIFLKFHMIFILGKLILKLRKEK
jgi:hypothetical protein